MGFSITASSPERATPEVGASPRPVCFFSAEAIDRALTNALRPYWENPSLLARLTGYFWWGLAFKHPDIPTWNLY